MGGEEVQRGERYGRKRRDRRKGRSNRGQWWSDAGLWESALGRKNRKELKGTM